MDKYEYFAYIHKCYFPQLRIGQFLCNFSTWINKEYGLDFFYLEDEELTGLLNDFAKAFRKTH